MVYDYDWSYCFTEATRLDFGSDRRLHLNTAVLDCGLRLLSHGAAEERKGGRHLGFLNPIRLSDLLILVIERYRLFVVQAQCFGSRRVLQYAKAVLDHWSLALTEMCLHLKARLSLVLAA